MIKIEGDIIEFVYDYLKSKHDGPKIIANYFDKRKDMASDENTLINVRSSVFAMFKRHMVDAIRSVYPKQNKVDENIYISLYNPKYNRLIELDFDYDFKTIQKRK